MMTGTCGALRAAWRSTSMPSTVGMRRSVITTSTSGAWWTPSIEIASAPSVAWITSWPSRRSIAVRTRRRFGSSSATRMRARSDIGCTLQRPGLSDRCRRRRRQLQLAVEGIPGRRLRRGRRGGGLGRLARLRRAGQEHREGRALARGRAHLDRARVLVDDPLGDRQAEAGAAGLGGEERDEQLLQLVARDAVPLVAEADLGELAVAEARAAAPRGQDVEHAAARRHRLDRV